MTSSIDTASLKVTATPKNEKISRTVGGRSLGEPASSLKKAPARSHRAATRTTVAASVAEGCLESFMGCSRKYDGGTAVLASTVLEAEGREARIDVEVVLAPSAARFSQATMR